MEELGRRIELTGVGDGESGEGGVIFKKIKNKNSFFSFLIIYKYILLYLFLMDQS
jgi:hypothetical protein